MHKFRSSTSILTKWKLALSKLSGEFLFFLGFIPILWALLWKTTTFPQSSTAELVIMAFFAICIMIKMLFFDHWKIWEIVLFAGSIIVAGVSFAKSGFSRSLVVVIAIFGAREVNAKKVLAVWLALSTINLTMSISAALLGIIENYKFAWDYNGSVLHVKNSLGIINTTDCAARIFFSVLVWLYIRRNKLNWLEYGFGLIIAVLTYCFTGGRIDSGCILFSLLLFVFAACIHHRRNRLGSQMVIKALSVSLRILAAFAFPLCATISFFCCYMWRSTGVWTILDKWTSKRLSIGHQIFLNYKITPFGQPVVQYGNGNGASYRNIEGAVYNFIDISYQSVLILYGLAFFILLMVLFVLLVHMKKQDTYLMICLIVTAINCMFAHHLTDVAYVPFWLLIFAVTDQADNEKGIISGRFILKGER